MRSSWRTVRWAQFDPSVALVDGDRSDTTTDREPVLDALRLADLWLDDATVFPSSATSSVAWSRSEWVEATLPAWRERLQPALLRQLVRPPETLRLAPTARSRLHG